MTEFLGRLVAILRQRSVQLGSFTLSSGRTSPYYIDARRATMSAEGIEVIGALGHGAIRSRGWKPNAIGGLTLGADPVAYAIARHSIGTDLAIDAFTVRKRAKDHGAGRLIEGCFEAGHDVVVVEDVVTTGQSALQAVEAVRQAGGGVLGVLAVIDREEGGRDAIEHAGYTLLTLVSLDDLGLTPHAD